MMHSDLTLPPAHHIGFVVTDAGAAAAAYEQLGYSPTPPVDLDLADAQLRGKPSPMSARYIFIEFGTTTVELIQPLSVGLYAQFLGEEGEGAHHVAFYVDNLDATMSEMVARYPDSLLLRASIPGQAQFAYLEGVLPGLVVELIQAD